MVKLTIQFELSDDWNSFDKFYTDKDLRDKCLGDWRHDGKKDVNTIYINSANCPSILKSWGYYLLQFPTREMAEEFIACFSDLIIIAKRFI